MSQKQRSIFASRASTTVRRLICLFGAFAASVGALYIFYLHPWLQFTSPLDPWLADQTCWFDALCRQPLALGHHLGLLLVLVALGGFAGAFWGAPLPWGDDGVRAVHSPTSPSVVILAD